MTLKLDDWQREVLATRGHIVLRSGRQVGKSTVIGIKAGEYATKNKNKVIMVVASVERQAYLLFEKILAYLVEKYDKYICQGKDRPTKSRVRLKNGSVIYCLPTGLSGHGIRGYTIDLLIADEAAFIPTEVFNSITPSLVTRGGEIILLSTPHGKDSYFYNCFNDKRFTKFHISSEDCPRMDKEFLKREKETMSKLQYAQEYLGEFVDDLIQYFPSDVIKQTMTLLPNEERNPKYIYFLGVDIARMGGDQSTYVIVEKTLNGILNVKQALYSENMRTTFVREKIKDLHRKWDFRRIYIDDGGLGAAVFDMLIEDEETKRVIEGINNSRKSVTRGDNPQRRRILKEDLYANLLSLMEHGKINLIKDPELYRSLHSIQYEYTEASIKIFGNYTHLTEGLIRACWCIQDKGLNIWISSI